MGFKFHKIIKNTSLALALLLFSQASYSNGLIDRFFHINSDVEKSSYKMVPVDYFVGMLRKTCQSDDFAEVEKANCYFSLVNELSSLLKTTLSDHFENIRNGAKNNFYTKQVAEDVINAEKKIQHNFDVYFNSACTEDNVAVYGSGFAAVAATCKMTLISERIKTVLNIGSEE